MALSPHLKIERSLAIAALGSWAALLNPMPEPVDAAVKTVVIVLLLAARRSAFRWGGLADCAISRIAKP